MADIFCKCPMPAKLAPQGMCPDCGVEAPLHQQALREKLAAGRPEPLIDRARQEGRKEGFQLALEVVANPDRRDVNHTLQHLLGEPEPEQLEIG